MLAPPSADGSRHGAASVPFGGLGEAEAPTLVVRGDRVIPVAQAREAAARLGGRKPEIFVGYGHRPHVECPDRFARTVLRFLDEAEALRPEGRGQQATTRRTA